MGKKKKKIPFVPRLLRAPTPSERVNVQAMYVTEYYSTVVMVIIHEAASIFFFCLQETLHPFGHIHPSSKQEGSVVGDLK